jgi:hypothetical protein
MMRCSALLVKQRGKGIVTLLHVNLKPLDQAFQLESDSSHAGGQIVLGRAVHLFPGYVQP